MKKHLVIGATIAALLAGSATSAMAAPYHGQKQSHSQSYDHRDDRRDSRHDHRYDRRDDRRDARQAHRWQRGQHFTGKRYVVNNYRNHRLSTPPRGYQWVQADNNFLLVAVTTGIIASVILSGR